MSMSMWLASHVRVLVVGVGAGAFGGVGVQGGDWWLPPGTNKARSQRLTLATRDRRTRTRTTATTAFL